jgi:hypothetical protein
MVSSRERRAIAMSLLLIRRRRPIGEPDGPRPGVATMDGIAGAGRIVHALVELDVAVHAMVQAVILSDSSVEDLARFDVGRRFETVVLGSHLINLPDEDLRRAFLALARRHLADGGRLLVEHHPVDWAETAAATSATPGSEVGMVDVRRDPPFVSAVSVYDSGGRVVRQPFTARVLSEEELTAELSSGGFSLQHQLGPTLIEAGPA